MSAVLREAAKLLTKLRDEHEGKKLIEGFTKHFGVNELSKEVNFKVARDGSLVVDGTHITELLENLKKGDARTLFSKFKLDVPEEVIKHVEEFSKTHLPHFEHSQARVEFENRVRAVEKDVEISRDEVKKATEKEGGLEKLADEKPKLMDKFKKLYNFAKSNVQLAAKMGLFIFAGMTLGGFIQSLSRWSKEQSGCIRTYKDSAGVLRSCKIGQYTCGEYNKIGKKIPRCKERVKVTGNPCEGWTVKSSDVCNGKCNSEELTIQFPPDDIIECEERSPLELISDYVTEGASSIFGPILKIIMVVGVGGAVFFILYYILRDTIKQPTPIIISGLTGLISGLATLAF